LAGSKKDVDARDKRGHDGGDAEMRWPGLALAVFIAALGPLPTVQAQTYPARPIKLVVPFAAGGAVDVLARLMGAKVGDQLGQTVVIENRPGAGGTLGADAVAKSPPDGYTILQNTNGAAIAPALYKSLPFDATRDFAPVTQLVASNLVLVASPKAGINSLKELIAQAKASPGKLNYGSSGLGNPLHLTMEMLKTATGTEIVSVPFRGDAQIHAALLAGDVQVAVVPLATAVPHIKEGRVRALAITGAKRSPTIPDVPTVAEVAVPGFAASGWQGWFMRAGTPPAIVDRVQQEVAKALALPDVRKRLEAMAYEPIGSKPKEFDAYFRAEIVKFGKVIADAKIPRQ
jgi:tripartite-type tricarboxylate transporter receptor subunit TctC